MQAARALLHARRGLVAQLVGQQHALELARGPFGLAAFLDARGLGAVLHQHRAHQRLAASQAGDHALHGVVAVAYAVPHHVVYQAQAQHQKAQHDQQGHAFGKQSVLHSTSRSLIVDAVWAGVVWPE